MNPAIASTSFLNLSTEALTTIIDSQAYKPPKNLYDDSFNSFYTKSTTSNFQTINPALLSNILIASQNKKDFTQLPREEMKLSKELFPYYTLLTGKSISESNINNTVDNNFSNMSQLHLFQQQLQTYYGK